jgi:hypothetical protein
MAFVPEGQLDSSQARCAWSHEENRPVPRHFYIVEERPETGGYKNGTGRLNGSRLRLKASEQEYLAFPRWRELSFDDKYLWH